MYNMLIVHLCVLMCVLCSSDSSDSRLPIIRREEASTDETYDETFLDERDQTMLSMDM